MRNLKLKRIDFCKRLKKEKKINKATKNKIFLILPFAVLLFAGGIATTWLVLKISNTMAQDIILQQYLDSMDEDAITAELEALTSRADILSEKKEELSLAIAAITSFPEVSSELLKRIDKLAEAKITISALSFDDESALLILNCSTHFAADAPLFVQRLKDDGLFIDVNYYGYELKENDNYEFSTECVLKYPHYEEAFSTFTIDGENIVETDGGEN